MQPDDAEHRGRLFRKGTIRPRENGPDVVRLDPDTGKQTVEAILPALPQLTAEQGLADGSAAFFDGSYYLLEPPFRQGGWQGYSELARITPLPATAG